MAHAAAAAPLHALSARLLLVHMTQHLLLMTVAGGRDPVRRAVTRALALPRSDG